MSVHPLSPSHAVDAITQAKIHLAAAHRLAVFHDLEEGIDNHFTVTVPGYEDRYLVLPFLSPLTVRDGVGYVFDLAMDPIGYFIPLGASIGRYAEDKVNYRAQNIDTFEAVEEGTLDLYSAVRNAYLKRREKQIKE